jgi:ABC-type transporter Mla MlaB component
MASPQSTVDAPVPEPLDLRRIAYRADLDVVLAVGELDRFTAPLLARELASHQPKMLVCDLSRVGSVDERGLDVLLAAADAARAMEHRFGVVAGPETTREMTRLSEAAARLDAFSTLSDAIRELPTT